MKDFNEVLAIFDFDKTLIKKDSFRIFSLLASDNTWEKFKVYYLAFCHKLKIINNTVYKVDVLRTVWFPKNKMEREILLKEFYKALKKFENERMITALKKHLETGDKVVVISASPLFYLEPYVKKFSDNIEVLGSVVRSGEDNTKLLNLYGARKESCAKEIIKKMKPNVVWVYTDHISDLPLIKLADKVKLINPSAKLVKKLKQLNIDHEIF